MEQGSLKKTQTPGPRPRRAPINLYGIRMSAYKHLYYGVGPVATPNWYGLTFVLSAPIRRALEIWAGSVMLDASMGPNGGLPSAVPPPIGSGPAIQFLRSWPMTWNLRFRTQEAFLGQRLIRRMTLSMPRDSEH